MIELKNVSKFYNDNKIVTVGLRNVSLKLNKGEFVAITGDSGSGKSTLLNVISSIDTYDEGEMLFYGNETFYFNQNDSDTFRKNNVSFIFQKYNIIDSYTVLENVMLPLLIKGKNEAEARSEALEIIRRVGLEDRADHRGTKLSGGEKQRCVIARALANDSPILACDEPMGNLDSKTSKEIIDLIKEVAKDKLVLVVTHDYDSIKDVATRKIKMSDGEIVEDVTLKDGVEEEAVGIELKASEPKKKTLFKLAFLNLLSTPKKSVFSTLVFTFVSCLLLLLSLLMIKVSYDENYTYNQEYGIITEDRVIIYDRNHASLDTEGLKSRLVGSEYYVNAFYEECTTTINIGESAAYGSVTFRELDFELINGCAEPKAGEFVLVVPENYYTSFYSENVGKEVSVISSADSDYEIPIGTLVGVGIADDETLNYPYLLGSEVDLELTNIMINNAVTFSYKVDGISYGSISKMYFKDLEKPYIAIPKELEGKVEFAFNVKGLYPVSYELEVVYTDEVTEPVFFVDRSYIEGKITPIFDGAKEITVYTDDVRGVSQAARQLGYLASVPSMVENSEGASIIVLYMLSFVIVGALCIMFYISFAVMQRIYLTKMKDYSIFRTLGLVSKDLKKVLFIEIMSITVTSIVLGGAMANLIIALTGINIGKYVSPVLIILYFAAMTVFGMLTANRLNNKIFKNSVYQSLREGGE